MNKDWERRLNSGMIIRAEIENVRVGEKYLSQKLTISRCMLNNSVVAVCYVKNKSLLTGGAGMLWYGFWIS